MINVQVDFDEKANEKLFLNWIKEKLENEKISLSEYLDLRKQINRDKPEPLGMEHFHLPIGMWFVGTLISIFCFLVEIIINWIRKRKAVRLSDTEGAEVDLAVSELPDKALQEEVQHNTDIQDIEDTA